LQSHYLRRLLVVSEVALALVALVGAGLFVKSFEAAQKLSPGFDPEKVLLVGLDLSASQYSAAQGKVFFRDLRQRLEALPGVKAVSYAEDVPLGFDGGSWEDVQIEGYVPLPAENMKIYRNLVAPGYLDVMGIPLIDGRDFRETDDEQSTSVVIVNETFVKRFLAGHNPLGRKIKAWGRDLMIVGVAKDSKYHSLKESAAPYLYVPFNQFYQASTGMAVHIRTSGPPETLLPSMHRELQSLDPNVAIFVALPLKEYIGAAYFTQKIAATLLSA
jgi:putative ABC transport system permease protein